MDDDIPEDGEITIRLNRRPDGGYQYTADSANETFSMGGGRANARDMLEQFEQILAVIEDRAGGGSGFV